LLDSPQGQAIQRILAAALHAVDPGLAVSKHLSRSGNSLRVTGQTYDLASFDSIYVIGAGKAGAPMAIALTNILGDSLTSGIVIVKEGYEQTGATEPLQRVKILPAGHPYPDERGLRATRRICQLLENTKQNDLVICLVSGGGSALLTNPLPGVSLEDLRNLTGLLLSCGATIHEINVLRKHLDQVKGGNLARLVSPAHLLTLILSDVVGNPLDIIASGPTVPDPSTYADATAVLRKYRLEDKVPGSIRQTLDRGENGRLPETPKPGDPLFDRVHNLIIGSNIIAAQAGLAQAAAEGYNTCLLTTYLQGEARQAGQFLAGIARQIADNGQPIPRPACLVAGGETTVTVTGDGLGGRNQEMALGAVETLAGIPEVTLVCLATDGGDGPTDAAGAVVTGETLWQAQHLSLDPVEYLRHNDAYHFFSPLGDLLLTGPTRTNVNDLAFLFLH
jgi:hydroxypyruvate reductase